MKIALNNLFNFRDQLQVTSLNERLKKHQVINANIVNAETPGFRSIDYKFEEQLQALNEPSVGLKTTRDAHYMNHFTQADGTITPDVVVRPTESVGHDGNTVDVDAEMVQLAKNTILYRATVEAITRKIGLLKYAIGGG